ncbi:MAG: 6-bladed beta-propeller, partial [Bacteroidia bacterium]|nr:6-bladed beta-propeller [Bacteroidia bacterium]
MKNSFFYLAIVFLLATMLFCSCNKVNEPAIQTIDLTGPVSKEVFKLSDIATDIEYVPLESIAESFIQQVNFFSVTDYHILIWDRFSQDEKVLLFDRQGKFLRPISRMGKGPGEYLGIRQVSFSGDKNSILILAANVLYKFNLEGILLETIKLENWPSGFAELGEKYLVAYSFPSNLRNGNFSFNLINHEGKTERQLFHLSESRFNTNGNLNIYGPRRFHDTLSFYTRRMDTIYGIDPDFRIWPRFVFKQNNWSVEKQVPGQ